MSKLPSALRPSALAFAAGGAMTLLWLAGGMRSFDLPLGDLLLRLPRPGAAVDAPVFAVLVDDAAIDALGPLPWPRAVEMMIEA